MAHPESTKKPTDFAAYQQFTSKAGELFIGKHSVSSLAKIAEQTPFYVYHKDSLNKRVEILRQALPETIELHYAIKSNPMPELIQHLSKVVDGFDVASGGELQVCLDAGILADKMSFAGPGKSLAELELAITNGAEIIPEVLAKIPNLNIEFIGFHIFSGSQNLQAESLIECQNKTIELAIKLSQLAPTQPKLINIGGGFGIPYFKGEKDLDVAAVGINLQHQLNHFHKFFPNCKIALELGRYISGPAGLYVCEVTDIKVSRGKKYLISNGGLHHHLAASGNFGQIIRKNYPVTIATKMDSEELEEVSIVGPLCTPLDLLADKMLLPKAEIGDLVVVYQSGAYGFSASPGKFLNHPEVVELLI